MNFILILISVILLIVIFYLLFKFSVSRKYNPVLVRQLVDGASDNNMVNEDGANYSYKYIVNGDDVPYTENSLVFGYSFWLYIDNVGGSGNWDSNFKEPKSIINRGDSPSIYYRPEDNALLVKIKTGDDNIEQFIVTKGLKTQKWNHVCVVLDTRNLDIYIEGKMARSFILKEVPKLNTNDIYIFDASNIYAELSYLRYFTVLLTPGDVEAIYNTAKFKEKIMDKIKTSNVYPTPTIFWWLYPWRNFLL